MKARAMYVQRKFNYSNNGTYKEVKENKAVHLSKIREEEEVHKTM